MTAEQLLDLLGMPCGEYGRNKNEPPDYDVTWWVDGQIRPAEIAAAVTDFVKRENQNA